MDRCVLQAPAKINLTLEVLAKRTDGYHGVRSVMAPLDLADELTVEPNDGFAFHCGLADIAGERNLAVAAMRTVFTQLPAVRITLRKRIPMDAGLGGGSSDAAAVLRAAMMHVFGAAPQCDWLRLARSLGSDVPFFLAGTAALVEGTGERVTPIGALPPWDVLIVKPPAGVSTAQAYDDLDALPRPPRPRNASVSLAMVEALQRGQFEEVEALLCNDFHDAIAARTPEIATALHALRAAGARAPMLTGSGSCVFALARRGDQNDAIAQRLALPPTYQTLRTRFGNAPGWQH